MAAEAAAVEVDPKHYRQCNGQSLLVMFARTAQTFGRGFPWGHTTEWPFNVTQVGIAKAHNCRQRVLMVDRNVACLPCRLATVSNQDLRKVAALSNWGMLPPGYNNFSYTLDQMAAAKAAARAAQSRQRLDYLGLQRRLASAAVRPVPAESAAREEWPLAPRGQLRAAGCCWRRRHAPPGVRPVRRC
jgi:hypothetical protein